jgi:hypothetical protein
LREDANLRAVHSETPDALEVGIVGGELLRAKGCRAEEGDEEPGGEKSLS